MSVFHSRSQDFAAPTLRVRRRQLGELEARSESGMRAGSAGHPELSSGCPRGDPEARPPPAEPGARSLEPKRGGEETGVRRWRDAAAQDSLDQEKPKVYQGVRVKITVKELLQQRRAHQAASGGTRSGGSSIISDPVTTSSAGLYFEPEPISSTPNYFQPRDFSSCASYDENSGCLDQIFDSYLQTETLSEPSFHATQSAPHYFPDGFQAAPFCFNQSLTPGSPSDSSTLSGSLDYSDSPAQLPPYTPGNFTSPTSVDTRNCGYPPEDCSYHPSPSSAPYKGFSVATSTCCCASCEAEHLDAVRTAAYFSYPGADCVDFASSAATASDFYARETDCDICYS